MEPNELVECANELMRALKEELAERGTVTPAFILLHEKDSEVLVFPPRLFASAEGTAAVARTFRNRALKPERMAPSWGWTAIALSPTSPR